MAGTPNLVAIRHARQAPPRRSPHRVGRLTPAHILDADPRGLTVCGAEPGFFDLSNREARATSHARWLTCEACRTALVAPASTGGGSERGEGGSAAALPPAPQPVASESGSTRVLVPAVVMVAGLVVAWLLTGVSAVAVVLYAVGGVMMAAGAMLLVARVVADLVAEIPTEDQP